jgi:hypothetical protein
MVLPGTYNEKNLLKDGVNWHFMTGARVSYTQSSDGGVFDDGSDGAAGPVISSITGFGEFFISSGKSTGHIINLTNSASRLFLEARSLNAVPTSCIRVSAGFGAHLQVRVAQEIGYGGAAVISHEGDSSDVHIEARNIFTSTGYGLQVAGGGGLYLKVYQISSSADSAVAITSGVGEIIIDAYEIISATNYGVHYGASSSAAPNLTIRNARLVSTFANATGYALYNAASVSDVIKLMNCVLIVHGTATYSAHAPSSTRIHFLGGGSSNKALSSNISVVGASPVISSFIA